MALNAAALTPATAATAYPLPSLHSTGAITSTVGAVSGPVVRVGYWSAATVGIYGGGSHLTGGQARDATGHCALNTLTATPEAS